MPNAIVLEPSPFSVAGEKLLTRNTPCFICPEMWPPNSPDVIVTDCIYCWLYSLYCISFVSVNICGLTILSVVFSLYSLRRCRSNINNALLSISTSLMWCWRQCSVQDLKRLSANINVLLILHFILTFVSYVLQQRELRVRIMFYHLQNSPSNNHTAQFLHRIQGRGDVIEVGEATICQRQ